MADTNLITQLSKAIKKKSLSAVSGLDVESGDTECGLSTKRKPERMTTTVRRKGGHAEPLGPRQRRQGTGLGLPRSSPP